MVGDEDGECEIVGVYVGKDEGIDVGDVVVVGEYEGEDEIVGKLDGA